MELNNPKTFSSHRTTPMTTTPFKIDLMDACMGDEAIGGPPPATL